MGEARGAGAPGPGGWPKPGCEAGGWPRLGCELVCGVGDNPGSGGSPEGTDGGADGDGELTGGAEAVVGAGGAGRPEGTLGAAGAGGGVLCVVGTGGLELSVEIVGGGITAAAPPPF
jgi:hypothetical protein